MLGVDNPAAVGASALLMSLVMQAIKNSSLVPWMTRQTGPINLVVSLVAAAMSAGVIHYNWDGTSGVATFALSTHLLWSFVLQWATQHAAYKTVVVPGETLGEIRALLQRSLPPPISPAEAKTQEAKK
jgi:hypothetical protein